MRELLYLMAVPLTSLVGLAAFTTWWSAGIFASGIGLVAFYTVKHHEKHHRPESLDDRLSAERMESAREWLFENSD